MTTTLINYYGAWTLYVKEVRRFLKVYHQTLFAPMVNALLLLAVFSLALGDRTAFAGDISFQQFMVPGLIMMTMVQNAFANTSSSLTMGKVLGSIIDYLLPPISPGEITLSMTLAGITRGVCTGLMVALATLLFAPVTVHDPLLLMAYALLACGAMSLTGMIAGILADTFDQMSAITSYVVTPLSFLSGTFYSVSHLPVFWQNVNHANPFFYMIDGFRYSMTGHADGSIVAGLLFLLATNVALYALTYRMILKGYRIKS